MNEEMKVEQPLEVTSQSSGLNNENEVGENVTAEGSILGKFDSVEALKKAYSNLEVEFTKKSQKLSEVLKRDNLADKPTTQNVEESSKPQPETAWKQNVAAFLSKNPTAKQFAAEITAMLAKDKVLAESPNSLELAFNKILASKYRNEQELVQSKEFLENYVYNNATIQKTIIANYLENLQKNKVPTVMASHLGTSVGLTPQEKPKNLQEANKLLERMLKQQ